MDIAAGERFVLVKPCSHRKIKGKLFLTDLRVAWCAETSRSPMVSFPLGTIKGNFPSVAGTLPMLKITTEGDPTDTKQAGWRFEFEYNDQGARDRDHFRDALITQIRVAAERDAQRSEFAPQQHVDPRRQLLELHSELKVAYAQLVETGTITEDEFWASRKSLLEHEAQQQGLASELVTQLRATQASGTKLSFTLTPEIIRQIFLELPVVERAYHDNVPDKISEEEFWKKYLQSAYFHRDKRRGTILSDDIFLQAESLVPKRERRKRPLDRTVDLTRELDDDDQRTASDAPDFVHRLNHHSDLVVGAVSDESRALLEGRIRSEVRLSDLEEPIDAQTEQIRFANSAHFGAGTVAPAVTLSDDNAVFAVIQARSLPDAHAPSTAQATQTILSLAKLRARKRLAQEFDTAAMREVKPYVTIVEETLRHYWANFQNVRMADKLNRLETVMLTKTKELEEWRKQGGIAGHLAIRLIDRLQMALTKHAEFKAKLASARR